MLQSINNIVENNLVFVNIIAGAIVGVVYYYCNKIYKMRNQERM